MESFIVVPMNSCCLLASDILDGHPERSWEHHKIFEHEPNRDTDKGTIFSNESSSVIFVFWLHVPAVTKS